jgi:hypothetical protein
VTADFDLPESEARASEVCGLGLDPPEGALVLSIDEQTSIQAKGLARPDRPPAPGRRARRDYVDTRNGTMNLFAALRARSGETHAMTWPARTATLTRLLGAMLHRPGPNCRGTDIGRPQCRRRFATGRWLMITSLVHRSTMWIIS